MIKGMDLQIIASQVPVWDRNKRVATAIDLLCLQPQLKRLVVVEVKVGFNETLFQQRSKKRMMKVKGKEFSNCPFNHHQLQLACTHHLFDATYRKALRAHRYTVGVPLLVVIQKLGMFVYLLDNVLIGGGCTQIMKRLLRKKTKYKRHVLDLDI